MPKEKYPMSMYRIGSTFSPDPKSPDHKIVYSDKEESLYEAAGWVDGHRFFTELAKPKPEKPLERPKLVPKQGKEIS